MFVILMIENNVVIDIVEKFDNESDAFNALEFYYQNHKDKLIEAENNHFTYENEYGQFVTYQIVVC